MLTDDGKSSSSSAAALGERGGAGGREEENISNAQFPHHRDVVGPVEIPPRKIYRRVAQYCHVGPK